MIEIICPSCQARYQLPEGSIGPEGRKVSCSSCSHKWRAHAEGAAPAATPFPYEPTGSPEPQPPHEPIPHEPIPHEPIPHEPMTPAAAPDTTASMAAVAMVDSAPDAPDFDAPDSTPPAASGNRDEQMAAIRQMLSDLKEGADAAPEPEPEEARPAPAAPAPSMRKRAEDEEDGRDHLKSRLDQLSNSGRSAKGQPEQSGYDAAKLRRMHEKRAKKLQRSRERRKKSGAFITGFTLVSVVAGTMVGLYVLKPQIIASSPEMAPAMNEYVVTVDRYRVELNETTAEWREWLVARIEGLTGKKEE
jgi:predicted Zn finger-like uncharacterized protein